MQSRYSVLRKLGSGASGVVSLVRRREDGRRFAAKEIDFTGTANEETTSRGMENTALNKIAEVALMNLPQHPSIVALEETIRTRTGIILILEYVPGGTLHDFVYNRPDRIPEADVARWLSQACNAMELIHRHSIIHRDLKLQNILVASEGASIKISDFGVATCVLSNGREKKANTSVGTPHYMAPEICEDLPYSSKCDVWSLGICFFEICEKRTPFEGNNLLALARAITSDSVPDITTTFYSPYLNDIIQSMLIKDQDARPSIPDVQNMLKQYFKLRARDRDDDNVSIATPTDVRKTPQRGFSTPTSESPSVPADSVTPMRNVTNLPANAKGRRSATPTDSDVSNDERRRIYEENRMAAARYKQRLKQGDETPPPPRRSPSPPDNVGNPPPDVVTVKQREAPTPPLRMVPQIPPLSPSPGVNRPDISPETDGENDEPEFSIADVNAEVARNLQRIKEMYPPTPRVDAGAPTSDGADVGENAPPPRIGGSTPPPGTSAPLVRRSVDMSLVPTDAKAESAPSSARRSASRGNSPPPVHYEPIPPMDVIEKRTRSPSPPEPIPTKGYQSKQEPISTSSSPIVPPQKALSQPTFGQEDDEKLDDLPSSSLMVLSPQKNTGSIQTSSRTPERDTGAVTEGQNDIERTTTLSHSRKSSAGMARQASSKSLSASVIRKPNCHNCDRQSVYQEAEYYCTECAVPLCGACSDSIHGISMFQQHALFRLESRGGIDDTRPFSPAEADEKQEGDDTQAKPPTQQARDATVTADPQKPEKSLRNDDSRSKTESGGCCCSVS